MVTKQHHVLGCHNFVENWKMW